MRCELDRRKQFFQSGTIPTISRMVGHMYRWVMEYLVDEVERNEDHLDEKSDFKQSALLRLPGYLSIHCRVLLLLTTAPHLLFLGVTESPPTARTNSRCRPK